MGLDCPEGHQLHSEQAEGVCGLRPLRVLLLEEHRRLQANTHRGPFFTKDRPYIKMDPTETELAGITNLAGVYTWAGVTGRLQAVLQEALGDPGRVREIALIPRPAWDTATGALQVRGPDDADGNPGPLRALSLVEAARVESARRVSLLLMGQAPDTPGAVGPPTALPQGQELRQHPASRGRGS